MSEKISYPEGSWFHLAAGNKPHLELSAMLKTQSEVDFVLAWIAAMRPFIDKEDAAISKGPTP